MNLEKLLINFSLILNTVLNIISFQDTVISIYDNLTFKM